MIRLKVKEVAEERGIASAADLARRTGLAFAKANALWKNQVSADPEGKRSVGLVTLYRVAQALGVKVADLIEEDWLALQLAAA